LESWPRTDNGRFAPLQDEVTSPFWEAAKEGRLVVQRCPSSGELQWPPRGRCIHDWTEEPEWIEIDGRGRVFAFTVIDRASHAYPETPYVLAVVELEAGICMTTNLVDVDPAEVRIGMLVEVRFEAASEDLRLPVFTPSPSEGPP
jgi:uncharacterized protein